MFYTTQFATTHTSPNSYIQYTINNSDFII